MSAVEELLHDHQILRAKLNLLEEWLPFAHAAPFTLRNILSTLARRLRSHTEKEERMLESLRQTQGRVPQLTTYLPDEHQDQQQTLAILLELLARGQACPVEQVETYTAHLIDSLREHMASEEASLFPRADRLLGEDQGREVADEHDRAPTKRPSDLAGQIEAAGSRHAGGARGPVCPA